MSLVFRGKATHHLIIWSPDDECLHVNKKKFGDFKTLSQVHSMSVVLDLYTCDQMVAGLKEKVAGWPVVLKDMVPCPTNQPTEEAEPEPEPETAAGEAEPEAVTAPAEEDETEAEAEATPAETTESTPSPEPVTAEPESTPDPTPATDAPAETPAASDGGYLSVAGYAHLFPDINKSQADSTCPSQSTVHLITAYRYARGQRRWYVPLQAP